MHDKIFHFSPLQFMTNESFTKSIIHIPVYVYLGLQDYKLCRKGSTRKIKRCIPNPTTKSDGCECIIAIPPRTSSQHYSLLKLAYEP